MRIKKTPYQVNPLPGQPIENKPQLSSLVEWAYFLKKVLQWQRKSKSLCGRKSLVESMCIRVLIGENHQTSPSHILTLTFLIQWGSHSPRRHCCFVTVAMRMWMSCSIESTVSVPKICLWSYQLRWQKRKGHHTSVGKKQNYKQGWQENVRNNSYKTNCTSGNKMAPLVKKNHWG